MACCSSSCAGGSIGGGLTTGVGGSGREEGRTGSCIIGDCALLCFALDGGEGVLKVVGGAVYLSCRGVDGGESDVASVPAPCVWALMWGCWGGGCLWVLECGCEKKRTECCIERPGSTMHRHH